MASRYLSVINLKPDLRTPKRTRIQKGLAIKLARILALMLLDASAIVAARQLAVYYGTSLNSPWTQNNSFLVIVITVQIAIIASQGLYRAGIHRRNYPALIKAISFSELLVLLIAFLYEPNRYVSRSTFLLFWLLSAILICSTRLLFDISVKYLRRKGVILHQVFLIADSSETESSIKLIKKEHCYQIQGIADSSCLDWRNREETFESLQKLGIEEAFVSWSAIKNRLYVCWHFQTAGITVRILPTQQDILSRKSVFWNLGDVPCLTIPAPILAGSDFLLKRCFDLACATILIFILSPVYLSIALLIKLDSPGLVFFKQDRIGLHGKKFKCWKFRTMVANAEKMQAELESKNEIKDGVIFKVKDDPRITKLGKFLRRYSLDELPQLFNVIFGEMSLVGPRPLPLRDVERFQSTHFIRQEVLPGITGLWQVSGRSNIENFEDGVKLDISYIENWSLWLDLEILLKTAIVVFQKTGAY